MFLTQRSDGREGSDNAFFHFDYDDMKRLIQDRRVYTITKPILLNNQTTWWGAYLQHARTREHNTTTNIVKPLNVL